MIIKKVLEILARCILSSKALRLTIDHLSAFTNGFVYNSYSLKDEVELALTFLSTNPSSSSVIIDAGANKGSYTLSLLSSGLKISKIIMIEPQPALYQDLRNISESHNNVKFEPVAIGSIEGKLELFFEFEGSALSSLYQRDVSHIGVFMNKSTMVPVTTLDQLIQKNDIEFIDYLKLDLEGHELEALKGERRAFEENRIKALAFEFGGCNIDSRIFIKDFWKFLVNEYGFELYRILPARHLLKLQQYSERLEHFGWQNILACAPGVIPTWPILD